MKVSVPKAAGVVSRREVTPGTGVASQREVTLGTGVASRREVTPGTSPALYRGTLTVPSPPSSPSPTFSTSASFPADTFLDMTTWTKGIVWVNGHNLGRFWSVGPQQTLYVPGCWLKPGANEVVVLDFFGPRAACEIVFCDKPILDVLHPETDFNRRERPATRFTGGREAAQGTFPNTDAAQVVLFDKPVRGTSFTLQVRSSYDPKNLASVAEFDLLGKDGNLLYLKMRTDTPQRYSNVLVEGVSGKCKAFLNVGAWGQDADFGGRTKSELKSYARGVTLRGNSVTCESERIGKGEGEYFELTDLVLENNVLKSEL